QPLATVVIDFGMVRAIPAEVGGRFVSGTPGYIAPEQVLDPVELDPRADVYALAATIYNVTTGPAFFDEVENLRDRVIAHIRRDPFDDAERLEGFPRRWRSSCARRWRAIRRRVPHRWSSGGSSPRRCEPRSQGTSENHPTPGAGGSAKSQSPSTWKYIG